jgi:hypothetical protein
MASDTGNVKLGVCQVFFDGVDLGYTKGGVEVEMQTETKKVEVDQFGKSPIDEVIMGRMISVKVPMAETTLENLARIMPGATLVSTGGVKATGTITITTQPVANDTVTVNGTAFTFKASGTGARDVVIGANAAATAAALNAKLISATGAHSIAGYTVSGAVITVTFDEEGELGNDFTLARTGTGTTVSGAKLTGGVTGINKRVVVPVAAGLSLLKNAKELRLHPKANAANDRSDDFVLPRANTPGALTFAYNFENERVYSATFTGYPDPVTETLYYVGNDPS